MVWAAATLRVADADELLRASLRAPASRKKWSAHSFFGRICLRVLVSVGG